MHFANPLAKLAGPLNIASKAKSKGLGDTFDNVEIGQQAKTLLEIYQNKLCCPVPIYDFDKVIDASEGTAKLSADFVKGHTEGGGKILKIARLPVEHFNAFKATVWKGRGGAAAAVTMLGLGAIEAKEGYAAEEARKAQFVPKVNENVIQPTMQFFSNAAK